MLSPIQQDAHDKIKDFLDGEQTKSRKYNNIMMYVLQHKILAHLSLSLIGLAQAQGPRFPPDEDRFCPSCSVTMYK